MTQLTQEAWEAMTQEERDKHLSDLVRWPRLDKPLDKSVYVSGEVSHGGLMS